MAATPLRLLLFLAGFLLAGAGTAYFTGLIGPEEEQRAEESVVAPSDASADTAQDGSEQQKQAATSDPQPKTDNGEAEAAAVVEAGTDIAAGDASGNEKVVVPAFDLLRAEPDGSLVIAGRAAPGSEVEIVSGSSVLANTTATETGDFAAVLEEPLEPGEHNIVLRSTFEGNAATSVETAIVSVPSDEKGQLVALVQQPGEPSRLISAPEPQRRGENGGEATAQGPGGQAEQAAGGDVQHEEGAAGQNADSGQQAPAVAEALPGTEGGEARASSPDEIAAAETDSSSGGTAGGQEEASTEATSPFIEAVEIDGREVFVAGAAEPGRLLRVYANDILLGQTTVSPEGRFLIEAERDLPVGDYIVRADVLDEDGMTVIARAAVPFERHVGENIAAVAPESLNQSGAPRQSEAGSANPKSGTGSADAPAGGASTSMPAQEVERGQELPLDRKAGGASGGAGSEQEMAARSGKTETETGRGSVAEVLSPALQSVDGAVVIRRGDTLWEISRRVYGRGVRYTTIYLANQEQIRDPDLIWPGQIFTVPDTTREGEKANLDAVGEQAVKPETTAKNPAPMGAR